MAFRAYYGDLMIRLGNRDEDSALRRKAVATTAEKDLARGTFNYFPEKAFATMWLREHGGEAEGSPAATSRCSERARRR